MLVTYSLPEYTGILSNSYHGRIVIRTANSMGNDTTSISELIEVSGNNQDSSVWFLETSRFWIQRILVPLVVGIGVLGNIVTIVVLTRRRMRSSTNVYLTALAVSDLLYLMFVFSLSFKHYPYSHDPKFLLYWKYYGLGTWFTDATTYTSIWLTVSFTVERYIAVCHPMRGKLYCTESRACKVIILVYIFCFVTTVTTFFEYRADVTLSPTDNTTVIRVGSAFTNLYDNPTYRKVFYWFTSITYVFFPLILLGIFNSFLIHAVHKSQKQRCRMTQVEQSDSVQTQENKITITLIAVVILFMVCQIPYALVLIYNTIDQPEKDSTADNILRCLGNVFNFLVTINAACNFMLYCALSDKYRRTFLITFLPTGCYRPAHLLHSMSRHNTAFSSTYDNGPYSNVHHHSMRASTTTSPMRSSTRRYDNTNFFNTRNSDVSVLPCQTTQTTTGDVHIVKNCGSLPGKPKCDKTSFSKHAFPFQNNSKNTCEHEHNKG